MTDFSIGMLKTSEKQSNEGTDEELLNLQKESR
jgi:hypothetical protein